MTTKSNIDPATWLYPTPDGLYCEPGNFYVDPVRPVDRAVITHGHADHARPGNAHVLATPETLSIMQVRYGERAGGALQPIEPGEVVSINGVEVSVAPAGHILGAAHRSSLTGKATGPWCPATTSGRTIRPVHRLKW
jgi:putative mRNA 3-end processing factor